MFKTAIIFLVFNRPDTTQKVFEAIRQVKPEKLLVVADGARKDKLGEAEKCETVRKIIDTVDWQCDVLKNYSDTNLGCKDRVSSGLDWAFERVEEAIVLEDDCLPHPTFFRFCEELLEKYRDDRRIMAISGDNFQFGRKRTEDSYYFSIYNHCWGWATWRRAWQYYDIDMKLWEKVRDRNWLRDILNNDRAVKYWTNKFQSTYEDRINSWAFRWTLACWLQSGLTVLPNVNLVSNIGFDSDGLHHQNGNSPFANMPVEKMSFPLQHPPFIIRNKAADDFTYKTMFHFWTRVSRKLNQYLTVISEIFFDKIKLNYKK